MARAEYLYGKTAIGIYIKRMDCEKVLGSILTPYCEENIEFHDMIQLMLLLDDISEKRGYPSSMYKRRTFFEKEQENKNEKGKLYRTREQMNKLYKNKANAIIYITSRKYATMQGHIVCPASGKIVKFQSELELICKLEEHYEEEHSEKIIEAVM